MEKKEKLLNLLESSEDSRRDFLKRAGKMALYTPPAIMLLMHPSRNALACSPRPRKHKTSYRRPNRYKKRWRSGRRRKDD